MDDGFEGDNVFFSRILIGFFCLGIFSTAACGPILNDQRKRSLTESPPTPQPTPQPTDVVDNPGFSAWRIQTFELDGDSTSEELRSPSFHVAAAAWGQGFERTIGRSSSFRVYVGQAGPVSEKPGVQ